jgi:hypothetical protein
MFSVTTLRQLKLSLIITGGQDLRLLGRCGHCFIKCSMAQTFVDKTLHLRHVSVAWMRTDCNCTGEGWESRTCSTLILILESLHRTLHLRHVSVDANRLQLHRGRMGKSHLLNADPDT